MLELKTVGDYKDRLNYLEREIKTLNYDLWKLRQEMIKDEKDRRIAKNNFDRAETNVDAVFDRLTEQLFSVFMVVGVEDEEENPGDTTEPENPDTPVEDPEDPENPETPPDEGGDDEKNDTDEG